MKISLIQTNPPELPFKVRYSNTTGPLFLTFLQDNLNLKRLLKFLEVTHVGSTLLEFSLKIAHFAHPNNERFFHNVPFDKKLHA